MGMFTVPKQRQCTEITREKKNHRCWQWPWTFYVHSYLPVLEKDNLTVPLTWAPADAHWTYLAFHTRPGKWIPHFYTAPSYTFLLLLRIPVPESRCWGSHLQLNITKLKQVNCYKFKGSLGYSVNLPQKEKEEEEEEEEGEMGWKQPLYSNTH